MTHAEGWASRLIVEAMAAAEGEELWQIVMIECSCILDCMRIITLERDNGLYFFL